MENAPENSPENPGNAVEGALQTQTEGASQDSGPGASTDGLAAEIAAQHVHESDSAGIGTTGKRPGRPVIHGRYSKAAGSDGKNPVPLPGEDPMAAPESAPDTRLSVVCPPDLFNKVVQEGLTTGELFIQSRIHSAALRAGLTAEEVAPQLARAQMGEKRKALVGELAPLVAQEWGVDPQLSPTAAVGMVIGPWLLASIGALTTLTKLAAERAQAANPQPSKQ